MTESYKVYFSDSYLLITSADEVSNSETQMKEKFSNVYSGTAGINDFFNNISVLFTESVDNNLLLVVDSPVEVLNRLKNELKPVMAAGGLVFNEKDEILLIFRRGKWDLAKGKIERGETMADGAVREVEEETAVKIKKIEPEPTITYHAYKLKGQRSIKETHWFVMRAKAGQTKLIPQTEEDIEDVRWVKKEDLKLYEKGCYHLIWDLLKPYAQ